MASFKSPAGLPGARQDADLDAHPASLVIENLASGRPTDKVNLSHLESWYEEYSKLLGKPQKFAHTPCEIKSSMDGETIKLPITCLRHLALQLGLGWAVDGIAHWRLTLLRFAKPVDGLPCLEDWMGCFESMFFGSVDLGREPLDVAVEVPPGASCSTAYLCRMRGSFIWRWLAPELLRQHQLRGCSPGPGQRLDKIFCACLAADSSCGI